MSIILNGVTNSDTNYSTCKDLKTINIINLNY